MGSQDQSEYSSLRSDGFCSGPAVTDHNTCGLLYESLVRDPSYPLNTLKGGYSSLGLNSTGRPLASCVRTSSSRVRGFRVLGWEGAGGEGKGTRRGAAGRRE